MPTGAEIKAKYKGIHDSLSEDYYKNHLMSKEDFDYYHGQNWADMEAELIAEGYMQAPTPPLSTHWAVIDSFNVGQTKPMRVKRTWDGREYQVNCYVTESVKDRYLAGDIAVGDYVMVEFLEDKADMAIVFAKAFKTW